MSEEFGFGRQEPSPSRGQQVCEPTYAFASTADFYPEEEPEGFVQWTFAVPKTARFGAGLFEIRHVRNLTSDEVDNGICIAGATRPEGVAGPLASDGEGRGERSEPGRPNTNTSTPLGQEGLIEAVDRLRRWAIRPDRLAREPERQRARDIRDLLAALPSPAQGDGRDELRAEVERLTRTLKQVTLAANIYQDRAEAAEARLADLLGVMREISRRAKEAGGNHYGDTADDALSPSEQDHSSLRPKQGFAPGREAGAWRDEVKTARDQGVGVGMVIAAAIIVRVWGHEVEAEEILGAAGITDMAAMRKFGVDAYDVAPLRNVLKRLKRPTPPGSPVEPSSETGEGRAVPPHGSGP